MYWMCPSIVILFQKPFANSIPRQPNLGLLYQSSYRTSCSGMQLGADIRCNFSPNHKTVVEKTGYFRGQGKQIVSFFLFLDQNMPRISVQTISRLVNKYFSGLLRWQQFEHGPLAAEVSGTQIIGLVCVPR
ncbi:hypothetical protein TNCT_90591 [Trichonephila clavata]|uniref:Uncharacterized protein n=1 Tax=Trichonephila clavata TaxID=2740835 RepID=A0A8X6L8W4_TRICU|nr:hypothetical protein TNCT_90591 [Trichonephila clavata]